jgi:UDP-N-acetylmuramoylalanine--D-glutamate ligase
LVGGSSKGEDFAALKPAVEAAGAHVYLNGETADALAEALAGAGAEIRRFGRLEDAFAAAAEAAESGESVLLSPAAASFDQFQNYGERGERFKQLVAALPH